jgi:hypothetical protein
MRAFVLVALALVVGGSVVAGVASGEAGQGHTALTITFWDEGQQRSADPVVWTLRCDPARGTHPRPELACRRLEAGGWKLVAPVGAGTICTEIYGGPQVARVVGTLEGRKVWARFTRTNGCQISRWNKLTPWLLPAGGVR